MNKRVLVGLLVGGLQLGWLVEAGAQEPRPSTGPMLVLEPGEVTTRFLDQPPLEEASTQLLARVLMVVPLLGQRVAVPLIVEWTPLKGGGGRLETGKDNTPSFLWGLTGTVFDTRHARFDVSALFDYAPDPTGHSNFAHQLVAEGSLRLPVGRWLGLPGNGRRLSTYTSFRYQLTGRPASETNPIFHRAALLYGLSLPVAPWN